MSSFNKCDICGVENESVKPGRWIFYCSKHKQNDLNHTMENEINPDLESGNMNYINDDPELQDILMSM